ncbi:PLP-dependent aminotransferase family protein [Hoeflea prorocentri]|uniref:PLP-dependent aminotransferase family protein n=1 Tax=Hoeflea prorocentri TaxID=1922333 RepID=A0A9X3UFG0_9HYPH|nr:PLP-dependent aminotransferase family protein [Hoeflea prorocentri]MCY6379915.1 PLP-dependent aminotransferase family protein [Hoeflea prorocentri]MDA5397715.1 PLP-dependent aminotransferase family protein [Hoeflea prorocentri]
MPIFQQVYEGLRARIAEGAFEASGHLPPTRALAVELGVSRSTIVTAYDQLVAEGYIEGRQGAGFAVCQMGEVEFARREEPRKAASAEQKRRGPRPFDPGAPDMRHFPYRQWARCVARVARNEAEALVMPDDVFGDRRLREAVCEHVLQWRGVKAAPEQVLITAGSGDALEICIRTIASRGDWIGLENPGYPQIRNFVVSLGMQSLWLEVDQEGAELPPLDGPRKPNLVVLTPSQQYPLGGAMTQARRLAFLNWSQQAAAWIIEDDYDSEFRYAGRPIPALAGFDREARTIYAGSFSKIFSNNLRIGYLVIPELLIDRFTTTLHRFGGKASIMPQRALAVFFEDGEFYRHLRRVRRVYSERRRVLIDLLSMRLGPSLVIEDHQAGMQFIVGLPPYFDDVALSRDARDKGLSVAPLSEFYAGPEARKGLVLGFCAFTPKELEAGVDKLVPLIEFHCGDPGKIAG